MRGCLRRFDDLRGDDQLLLEDQEGGVVVMSSSVIRGTGKGDQLCRCKAIYAILAVLMCPHDNREVIGLQEFLNLIRAIDHNVVLLLRVSLHVLLKTEYILKFRWVTPQ